MAPLAEVTGTLAATIPSKISPSYTSIESSPQDPSSIQVRVVDSPSESLVESGDASHSLHDCDCHSGTHGCSVPVAVAVQNTQPQTAAAASIQADVDAVDHRDSHHLRKMPELLNADVVAPKTKEAAPSDIPLWLKGVKRTYHVVFDNSPPFLALLLLSYLAYRFIHLTPQDLDTLTSPFLSHPLLSFSSLQLLLIASLYFLMSRPVPVYMMDLACAKPSEEWAISKKASMEAYRLYRARVGTSNEDVEAFTEQMLHRLGLGDRTYINVASREVDSIGNVPDEFVHLFSLAVDEVFAKTGVQPKDVGVLVVATPTALVPSSSSYIINRYKMRESIASLSLAGMGCSGGTVAVSTARDLLQSHRNTYALVVNATLVSGCGYFGNDKSAVLTMSILRNGCSAVLLSNKRSDARRAKYKFVTSVRTHLGAHNDAFNSLVKRKDSDGRVGYHISRTLIPSAGQAIKKNIATLAPLTLPLSEKLVFVAMAGLHKLLPGTFPKYVPDFKLAFDHFLFHVGGSVVLDAMEKSLGLSPEHLEASRSSLHRWGNMSCSSASYCLTYQEAKGRVRRGDRVWQIQFGSGFKCASVVWRALRDVKASEGEGAWGDCIHQYPINDKTVYDFDPWKK